METLLNKLAKIQSTISVAKNQKNSFGNYNYRSCEDILQALQPMVKELNVVVLLSDEIKELMNGWVYVEATATIKDCESNEEISVKAQAGIQERKGMDLSQTFGASSSYARKYALNGLFKLDDNKDADTDAFTKLIKAENNDFKKEDNKIIKQDIKTSKNAENKGVDNDLPFLDIQEKNIHALEIVRNEIEKNCKALDKKPSECYGYFCKEWKVNDPSELNEKQLNEINDKLVSALFRLKQKEEEHDNSNV